MKTVHLICAARPNFMKIAPLYHALKKTDWCRPVIVRVLQHTDENMSWAFFNEFGLANVGWDELKPGEFHAERPDAVVVPGDVNASADYAVQAARRNIPVVHLEAGLRSFDWSMPEEVNRVVVDSVSSLLLTPDRDSHERLRGANGKPNSQVHCVGNIMIDTFEMLRPLIEIEPVAMGGDPYAVVTLHRPSNVDDPAKLANLWDQITELSNELPVVFPVHPRTKKQFCFGQPANVWLEPPMPYAEFMALVKGATIVITDSGGVQEETSYLGVPCATVRENTERPITISHGTNVLIRPDQIVSSARKALAGEWKKGVPIPLWDGHTAERCVDALHTFLTSQTAKGVAK